MKFKFLKIMVAIVFVAFLAACGGTEEASDTTGQDVIEDLEDLDIEETDIRIALITHSPESVLDDGSFNEGTWTGIQNFLSSNDLPASSADSFVPHEASDEARRDLMIEAIENGFNVLVLPGHQFNIALYEVQDLFPSVHFLAVDGTPQMDGNARIEDNVTAIHYAAQEAGFLAGYSAVMEGYRNLGFMGGIAVPAVIQFGHGFVQGAEHAANSLGLAEGDVTINYTYLGGFAPDPAHTTTAAAWFASGTEVIFAAAGGAGGSVMSAAESAGASVIGVDVDQSDLSSSVVISAVKGLGPSVYDILTSIINDTFTSGEIIFTAAENGVGLSMESSRFENFTQEQYEFIFSALANNEIEVSGSLDLEDIPVSLVTLNEL